MNIATFFVGIGGTGFSLKLNSLIRTEKKQPTVTFIGMEMSIQKSTCFSEIKSFDIMLQDYYLRKSFNLFRNKNIHVPTIKINIRNNNLVFNNESTEKNSFCFVCIVTETYFVNKIYNSIHDFIHRHAVY